MASLNLLRYLVIKDNENNQVSELFEKETVSIFKMYRECSGFLINTYLSQYLIT